MAEYDFMYACGHRGRLEVPDDGSIPLETVLAMQRREGLCPACRAAESDLEGSVRQVMWAEDIRLKMRREWNRAVRSGSVPEQMQRAFREVWGESSAAWWIENRERSIFSLVRERMMELEGRKPE